MKIVAGRKPAWETLPKPKPAWIVGSGVIYTQKGEKKGIKSGKKVRGLHTAKLRRDTLVVSLTTEVRVDF